jgi:hypothetical protein
MDYLPKEKLNLHLKLGREIVHFLQLGQYFETKTFDYLQMVKSDSEFTVKMVQALDYMYSFSPSMEEFETVEELEGECESIFSGSLEDCLNWAESKYSCPKDKWSLSIIDVYVSYVDKEILGQGSDHD